LLLKRRQRCIRLEVKGSKKKRWMERSEEELLVVIGGSEGKGEAAEAQQ
jgi:hypothetical protein